MDPFGEYIDSYSDSRYSYGENGFKFVKRINWAIWWINYFILNISCVPTFHTLFFWLNKMIIWVFKIHFLMEFFVWIY